MDGQHMGDALNDDQLIFGEDRGRFDFPWNTFL